MKSVASNSWSCGLAKTMWSLMPKALPSSAQAYLSSWWEFRLNELPENKTSGAWNTGRQSGHVDPSAAGRRHRRQPESPGAAAAEKQMARRRTSRNYQPPPPKFSWRAEVWTCQWSLNVSIIIILMHCKQQQSMNSIRPIPQYPSSWWRTPSRALPYWWPDAKYLSAAPLNARR